MKAIIQIPCLNEATTLPLTLAELPRHITGLDRVEWLVVELDACATDMMTAVEKSHDYLINLGELAS